MEILKTTNELLDAMVTGMMRGFALAICWNTIWFGTKWIWKKLRQGYRFLFKRNR